MGYVCVRVRLRVCVVGVSLLSGSLHPPRPRGLVAPFVASSDSVAALAAPEVCGYVCARAHRSVSMVRLSYCDLLEHVRRDIGYIRFV